MLFLEIASGSSFGFDDNGGILESVRCTCIEIAIAMTDNFVI